MQRNKQLISLRRLLPTVFAATCLLAPPQGNDLNAQAGCSSTAPPCVLTGQYGNLRQAYNAYEASITPSNVSNMAEVSWSPLQLTGLLVFKLSN